MDKTGICILKRYVSGRKAHDDALSEIVSSLSLIVVLIIATGIILSFSTGQYPKVTIPHAELTKYEGSKFVNFSLGRRQPLQTQSEYVFIMKPF